MKQIDAFKQVILMLPLFLFGRHSPGLAQANGEVSVSADGRFSFDYALPQVVLSATEVWFELALSAFSRRYLKNGTWESKDHLTRSIRNSLHEYYRLFAHPFQWTFSQHRLHNWYRDNRCAINSTRH